LNSPYVFVFFNAVQSNHAMSVEVAYMSYNASILENSNGEGQNKARKRGYRNQT